VPSGRELKPLKGPAISGDNDNTVKSVAFSPDSQTLASGSDDSTINLWEVASGQELKTLKSVVKSLAFSPDGKTLASGSAWPGGTVTLWDVPSGKELKALKGQSSAVLSVAFSADGKTLIAIIDNNTIKLWEVASGQELKTLKMLPKESSDVQRTPAAPPTSASTQTYTEVLFEEVKDLDGLAKSFPFLKEDVDDVITNNKDTTFERTNVYVSDLHQKGQARLLFVALDGMLNCGTGGCSLTVYMDQGNGFKDVLDALAEAGSPVYISKDQLSLVTCGGHGRVEWRFENNAFKSIGNYARSQKLKPC
jgi:WD40 repeat protein